MGMNDFILNCEKDNNDLRKNIEYYKNKTQRLQKENAELKEENQQLKHILDELEKWAEEGDKESLHIPYEGELDFVDVLDEIKELRGRENE